MSKKSLLLSVVLAACWVAAPTVQAGLIQISTLDADLDAEYLAVTTNISILSSIRDYTNVTSLADESLTVNFSDKQNVRTVGVGWNTWSSAPYSESANPRVLYGDSPLLTIHFSQPLDIFGIEAEPNPYSLQTFTTTFFNDSSVVGSFSQNIHGFAGARLLAASASDGSVFTSVTISATRDFAVGQFRYRLASTTVSEPAALNITVLPEPAALNFSVELDPITVLPASAPVAALTTAIPEPAPLAARITVLPEPAPLTLLGVGLAGLGFIRRRQPT